MGIIFTRKFWKRCLILTLIFITYAFTCTAGTAETPVVTTIGQLSDEIKAVADRTPTALAYTEFDGSPEPFCVLVDDPAIAKEALEIILNASVDRRGCQVDMCQYRYEEYRFVFGEETYAFGFIPASYFCYDSQYYELRANRLDRVRDFLREEYAGSTPSETEASKTATEPQSKWYGDGAVLETDFLDNGDEARSLTELTLSADGETLTGFIEGAYDVLSIDKQPDGYVIRYTYGDFYSHEAIRSCRVTVENGEMVIAGMAE